MAIRTTPPQSDDDAPRPDASAEDHALFQSFMETHRFRFAKTMAAIPHSYTRRSDWARAGDPPGEKYDGSPGDLDFQWAARFILTHGTPRRFYSRTFIYYDLGEYEYWNMDGTPEDSIELINRAKKKNA
jgi:hypothetical protein